MKCIFKPKNNHIFGSQPSFITKKKKSYIPFTIILQKHQREESAPIPKKCSILLSYLYKSNFKISNQTSIRQGLGLNT